MTTLERAWRVNRGLLVLLGIVGITGIIHFFVINQRAFLNFYYLPVVIGAYTMGLRRGVYSAMLSCGIVFGLALLNEGTFGGPELDAWTRWLDLVTWASFLLLTAYVVGTLYEEKERQLAELQQAYQGILEIIAKFIDSADQYTENHSRRVADYSVAIAREMGLDLQTVEDVRVGAYLHDIGKIDVSAEVLRKAAGLTPEEMEEMKLHVDSGVRLVRSMGGILRHVVPMVAFHHERWDGAGYKGIAGDDIPIGARIIAVADTYDAIVTHRSYRNARTPEEAVQIIRAEAGHQFDPEVVRVFTALYGSSAETPRTEPARDRAA